MKTNQAMRTALKNVKFEGEMPSALRAIADGGFDVRDDCHFLAALLAKAVSVTRERFDDCTGYECFVNSLHVEDYDARDPLSQSIRLIQQVFRAWPVYSPGKILVSIVSADELSVVVKFYVKRKNEAWLSDDLEGYGDPIMLIESSEDVVKALGTAG